MTIGNIVAISVQTKFVIKLRCMGGVLSWHKERNLLLCGSWSNSCEHIVVVVTVVWGSPHNRSEGHTSIAPHKNSPHLIVNRSRSKTKNKNKPLDHSINSKTIVIFVDDDPSGDDDNAQWTWLRCGWNGDNCATRLCDVQPPGAPRQNVTRPARVAASAQCGTVAECPAPMFGSLWFNGWHQLSVVDATMAATVTVSPSPRESFYEVIVGRTMHRLYTHTVIYKQMSTSEYKTVELLLYTN